VEQAELVIDEFGHALLSIPGADDPWAQVFKIQKLWIDKVAELPEFEE